MRMQVAFVRAPLESLDTPSRASAGYPTIFVEATAGELVTSVPGDLALGTVDLSGLPHPFAMKGLEDGGGRRRVV
jgi:hypothetical protein